MDGLKLTLQQSPDTMINWYFYNGWKHDHYIINVYVFAPDKTIVAMSVNGPGILHESNMKKGDLYGKF